MYAYHRLLGGPPMFFAKETIAELEKGRSEIAGKYQNLVDSYLALQLQNKRAREFAT